LVPEPNKFNAVSLLLEVRMISQFRIKAAAFAAIGMVALAPMGSAVAAVQVISNANFSVSYNDATRYGTATLVGNAISFDLVNTAAPSTPWIAQSLNGAGAVAANSTIALTLTINNAAYANGFRFDAFDWLEGGDYYLNEASSSVRVLGQLRAISTALPTTTTTTDPLSVLSPGLGIVGANTDWFADSRLDSTTACGGPGCSNVFTTNPQQIQLQIENRLTATSMVANSEAFIEKKLGAGSFTLLVSQVPEVSTWGMMSAGLLCMGLVARRRMKGELPSA
jgi:hypothetical protein